MGQIEVDAPYTDHQGRRFLAPVIDMKEDGTLVLPPEVLKALHVKGCETFTFEVDEESGAVTLYAVGDDDWADDPEFIERARMAQEDIAAGRTRQLSEEELRKLLDLAE